MSILKSRTVKFDDIEDYEDYISKSNKLTKDAFNNYINYIEEFLDFCQSDDKREFARFCYFYIKYLEINLEDGSYSFSFPTKSALTIHLKKVQRIFNNLDFYRNKINSVFDFCYIDKCKQKKNGKGPFYECKHVEITKRQQNIIQKYMKYPLSEFLYNILDDTFLEPEDTPAYRIIINGIERNSKLFSLHVKRCMMMKLCRHICCFDNFIVNNECLIDTVCSKLEKMNYVSEQLWKFKLNDDIFYIILEYLAK